MITIGLHGARFPGEHGVHPTEAVVGGDFEVDVSVALVGAPGHGGDPGDEDDLGGTVDYARLYDICAAAMAVRTDLLETVAARIEAEVIALGAPGLRRVEVTVRKLHPPLGGRVGAAWVRREAVGPFGAAG